MDKKNSTIARILAVLALVGAVVVVVSVITSETGNDSPAIEQTTSGDTSSQGGTQNQKPTRKVYVVQEGDSLIVIARENGISVTRIESLNPGLDPQALIPGQKLKLR